MARDTVDAPRRCFICLDDENFSDSPNSWVDPCPCTDAAHQECILLWVDDCERSSRLVKCPICEAVIKMEEPWDPFVKLSDMIAKLFSRTHPLILSAALLMGSQFTMQMYGAIALWTFSGADTMMHFVMGPQMVIDGGGMASLAVRSQRITNALILASVAPALLVGRVSSSWSNKIFLPTASFYGVYHIICDKQFFAWPPSPQLAMAVFPHMRFVYHRLYEKLVLPYETKLNRLLLGLPPVQPQQEPADEGNQNRGPFRNRVRIAAQVLRVRVGLQLGMFNIFNREVIVEGELEMDEAALDVLHAEGAPDAAAEAPAAGAGENGGFDGVGDIPVDAQVALPADLVPAAEGNGPAAYQEAPDAPAGDVGLSKTLSGMSNAIVAALILPGVSFAFGEALRLVLTSASFGNSRTPLNSGGCGSVGGRPGLFQQRWGRSLVGGCLFIVLRDILCIYTKTRKVAQQSNSRIKNVNRPGRLKK